MSGTIRQAQKEHTREMILSAAYEYFSAHGILITRMSDIAQVAGVSHGTVFLHFKTQETLLTAVVETYCGRIAARTHELADPCGTLRELLTAHLAGITEYEPFYTRLVVESRLLPQAARDAWVHLQSAVSFHFSRALERDREKEKIKNIPPALLFNMWLALIHYYLANGNLFAPGGKVMERCGGMLIANYLKMIEAGDGGQSNV